MDDSRYVWKSKHGRDRLIRRLEELTRLPVCRDWQGSSRPLNYSGLGTVDTWLSRLESQLAAELNCPPVLLGLFQAVAWRLPGNVSGAWVLIILSQLRHDFPQAVLGHTVESLAACTTLGTADNRPGRRPHFATFVLMHPKSQELCEVVMTVLSHQLAAIDKLRDVVPEFTAAPAEELQPA